MDPGTSGASPAATPVDVEQAPRAHVFAQGIAIGLGASAVLVHVFFATQFGSLRGMYAELGGALPAVTRLTISPAWLWGVPVLGAIELAVLAFRRPRWFVWYAMVAGVLFGTVIATWYAAQAPLRETFGNIKAE